MLEGEVGFDQPADEGGVEVGGGPTNVFVGEGGQDGDEQNAGDDAPDEGHRPEQGKEQYRQEHKRQQKRCPAPGVFQRVAGDVFGGQFIACFKGVDRFVFCAVIAKDTLDVFQLTDGKDVADQQNQPDHTLHQIAEPG